MLTWKLWSAAVTVTILRAWIMPTWMRWVATMMEPRWDTRRCTVIGPSDGAGTLVARQAPKPVSVSRLMGQGMVRSCVPARPTSPTPLTIRLTWIAKPVPVGKGEGPAGRAPSVS